MGKTTIVAAFSTARFKTGNWHCSNLNREPFNIDHHSMNSGLEETIKTYFKRHSEVIAVYLFGSYSRGKMHHLSDIDIGVLLDQNNKEFQKANNLPADGRVDKQTWTLLRHHL